MKTLRKLVIVFIAAIAISISLKAQDYKTEFGFRAGGLTSGLTVKHFINSDGALEGIMSFGYRSTVITGLYEKHENIPSAQGLKWFYGGGAHIGFFSYGGYYYTVHGHGNIYYVEREGESASVGGLDFIIGLDYKFNKAPVNVSLDIKPFVDFFNGTSGYFDGALSFRFVF